MSRPLSKSKLLILVLHGPEIFDAGDVPFLIDRLRPGRVIVAGVMARTAAEESGIPCEFISLPPSMVIRDLPPVAVLANHGKTPESGRIFGEIVASRLFPQGLIQIEASSRTLYGWNREVDDILRSIARKIGYTVELVSTETARSGNVRTIRGCKVGEPVYVNGTVIGHATGPEVALRAEAGKVIPISGLAPKTHGLERLEGLFSDLSVIWCKSGSIRTAIPEPSARRRTEGRVLLIDHCGHDLYRNLSSNICGIVSIGDDTTAVCGHVAAHLGIPVLGIIDGDADGIVPGCFIHGSVIARAIAERDDEIGREIQKQIPDDIVMWDRFVERIVQYLGSRVEITRPSG
jgi:hypothetical protein